MTSQSLKKISELDVFCLIAFKVIFQTGHANIAAKQLNVSAPKISRCLNMLRATFDDELFYRRQLGLKPTPLAEYLYEPICQFCDAVLKIEQSVAEKVEEHSVECIKIAVASSILASLSLAFSRSQYRHLIGKLQFVCWDSESADLIHNGEIDIGVAFDTTNEHQLSIESLGALSQISIAAEDAHPIWTTSAPITLETICSYPFLCLDGKGFNDKIDPLEVFARQAGVAIESITRVSSRDEWYSHLLTMGSISFLPCSEAGICTSLPGIKVESLSTDEVERLHGESMSPEYMLIENPQEYRRYSIEQRELIIQLIKKLLVAS
ncbi:LysR family transcriptional regulator [Shewanella psychrotolerans]|uniref:LysR family transcriptional regulator n=1 Tax=Shewanella psychrotolerans TaxID=2864206 RepID=UPI001C65B462|nr:LysR family transcriptional regulator [Shewanella psychrotolerans]QYK02190.1 LysR family transcriptional regulator [Shewanella psychrotolerans]